MTLRTEMPTKRPAVAPTETKRRIEMKMKLISYWKNLLKWKSLHVEILSGDISSWWPNLRCSPIKLSFLSTTEISQRLCSSRGSFEGKNIPQFALWHRLHLSIEIQGKVLDIVESKLSIPCESKLALNFLKTHTN